LISHFIRTSAEFPTKRFILKRLNFEHLPAEKSSMNKVDSFFVLIVVLLSGLTIVYKSAQYDLGETKLLALQNHYLKNQIRLLELKQKDLELKLSQFAPQAKNERAVASVAETHVEVDPNQIARGIYQEVLDQCVKLKKDLPCLNKVDSVVSQFPESKWAGKSLVVLTHRYVKEKRYEQASELVQIVRHEFTHEPEVLHELKEIEKN
jgi:hypothetical protein